MGSLVEQIHEAAGQYRAQSGCEPNCAKMHPMTYNAVMRELDQDSDEPVNRDTVKVAGCRLVMSMTCPKGHMLMVEE